MSAGYQADTSNLQHAQAVKAVVKLETPRDPVITAYLLFAQDLDQFVLTAYDKATQPSQDLERLEEAGGHFGYTISFVDWVECEPEYQERVKMHITRVTKKFNSKRLLHDKLAYLVRCSLGKDGTCSNNILLTGFSGTPG